MTDGAVDLQALITAFLADASQTTLELPQTLSADERKEARRLADQHAQLKCESYGFGEERRLHIFKKNQDRLKVKNTFIDGWEGEQTGAEAPAFRSMPPNMPDNLLERTLQRCLEGGGDKNALLSLAALTKTDVDSGVPDASPTSSVAKELPPLPDGFQVRNTFIHIESVPVVERIVQSMPHGMFSECLKAELSEQYPQAEPPARGPPVAAPTGPPTAPPTTAAPAIPATSGADQVLVPGTEVIIQGLVKLPDFNGLSGVVQSLDPESGRYDVLLDGPAGQCGWRWVKVKGENCRLCMPPPPANAPTLSMECEGGASEAIPPTPKWEDGDQGANATTLSLNALV
eukprot:TRINITY_DN13489_c1_g1_i1.p1 TRINITY_DN13489_c1_g1~~TRINITY_DN13489_c1_g1_i1.p1  ORF type:complete len:344 (+),score=86.55 TRINITY_DN13489_c1_g1_i1:164-1195(+)